MLTAMIAGQHALLLGPPGTGKSALCRSIASTVSARFWPYLFSRTTTPDEVFGPLDIGALKTGRYERITSGRLADCEVAFLDEIGKANSTVVNGMLTAINERTFDAGRGSEHIPLRTVLAASNELPDPRECGAFLDRFLVRLHIGEAEGHDAWRSIVSGTHGGRPVGPELTLEDWSAATEQASKVEAEKAVETLLKVKIDLEARSIVHTARRWKAIVALVKASAWIAGRSVAIELDVEVARHCLWRAEIEREIVNEVVLDHADGAYGEAKRLYEGASEALSAIDHKDVNRAARALREANHVHSQLVSFAGDRETALAELLARIIAPHKAKVMKALGVSA
jgi:MoxR-like ATPase